MHITIPSNNKALTLIYHAPEMDVVRTNYASRLKLTVTACLHHAEQVKAIDPRVGMFVSAVFPFFQAHDYATQSEAVNYIVGLVDLTLKLHKRTKVVWAKPETFLHPVQQLRLADMSVTLAKFLNK